MSYCQEVGQLDSLSSLPRTLISSSVTSTKHIIRPRGDEDIQTLTLRTEIWPSSWFHVLLKSSRSPELVHIVVEISVAIRWMKALVMVLLE